MRRFFENPDLRPGPREGGEASGAAHETSPDLRRGRARSGSTSAGSAARSGAGGGASRRVTRSGRGLRGFYEVVSRNDGGGWFFMRFRVHSAATRGPERCSAVARRGAVLERSHAVLGSPSTPSTRRLAYRGHVQPAVTAQWRRSRSFTSAPRDRPGLARNRLKNQKETTQRHDSRKRVAPTACHRRGTAGRRATTGPLAAPGRTLRRVRRAMSTLKRQQ